MNLGDVDVLARRFADFLNGEAPPLQPSDSSGLTFDQGDLGFASCLIFAAGWYAGQEGADVLVPTLLDGALREGAVPQRWRPLIDRVLNDLALEQAGAEAIDWIDRFLDDYDNALVNDAIAKLRRVCVDGGGRLPHHASHLTALMFGLWLRWQDDCPNADLDEVVRIGAQESGRLTEEGADLYGTAVRELSGRSASPAAGTVLAEEPGVSHDAYRRTRFEIAIALRGARIAAFGRTGEAEHLDEVIRLGEVALAFAARDERAELVSGHAEAVAERFVRSGSSADRDAAVKATRRERIEHPREHERWFQATAVLRELIADRYRAQPMPADLDSLIDLGAELLQDRRTDPQRRVDLLRRQVDLLWERCNRELRAQDLELAVAAGRELIELTGDADPGFLSTMCFLLCHQFPSSRNLDDLRLAVELGRRATAGPADQPGEQARRLDNLFNGLIRYAEETGSIADFDAAVEAAQAAVDLYPDGHPERAPHLVAVASAWCGRFQRSGVEADLAAAIRCGRAAVASAGDEDQRVDSAAVLVVALAFQLGHFDDTAALDEALELLRRGWRPDPGWLQGISALVGAVRDRADALAIEPGVLEGLFPALENGLVRASVEMAQAGARAKETGVVDMALELLAAAEEIGAPERADMHGGLRAQFLMLRWQITGRRDEIDAAIEGMIQAGTSLADRAPELAGANLRQAATALYRRFRRRRNVADLQQAARQAERALKLIGDDPQEQEYLTEFIAYVRKHLDTPPFVMIQSDIGEGDREGLHSRHGLDTVHAWNSGQPRRSGLAWLPARPGARIPAESDPGSPRVLFLRTFTETDTSNAVLNSVAMALDGTDGRIEIVSDLRDREAIERSWTAAFGDRPTAERIDFVASTRDGWRRDVLKRIEPVDAIVFYVSPKDAEFPEFRFGPPATEISADRWDRYMDEPLSFPITGPGLLREVAYVNRMGRLPITILICDDRHQPTLEDLIALAGVMGDATDIVGNFITPRLTAIDKQVGHLAKAYQAISYRPEEGAPVLPDLAAAVRNALCGLKAARAVPETPRWNLDDLWGRSPHPRLLPPDDTLKIIEFSDVETLLFLPSRELTDVDPREIPLLLNPEAVATGCPYCRAPVDRLFFYRNGLWTADRLDQIQAARIRAICQVCGRRSSLELEILMPQ